MCVWIDQVYFLFISGELNDLDFWLSSSSGAKPDTPKQPAATTSATTSATIEDTAVEEAGKKKRKKGEKVKI